MIPILLHKKRSYLFPVLLTVIFSAATISPAFSQNWRLITPAWPATDAPVIAYSVADYGATGDGVTDVTSIFQNLLDSLGLQGGGTLFVPQGKYVIKGNLLIPKGITLRGEWQQPVPGQPIVGTILMAYAGQGNENATAFLTLQTSAAVRDLSIWYPQQNPNSITPYPPAILFGQTGYFGNEFCNAKDITFVNAYDGVMFSEQNGGTCPVIFNVYGTPLSKGIQIDDIVDVGRLEQIGFSPAYWSGSGLPGAPAAGSSYSTWIYQNGTGIVMRRNDWTNTSFVNIQGYNIGFHAAVSLTSPGTYPNGHNYGMSFTNCQTAVQVDGLQTVGVMFTRVSATNCQSGFVLGPNTDNGAVQLDSCTISATGNAISIDSTSTGTFLMEQSTISSGRVNIGGSTFTASDCDFNNGGPQLTIGRHARTVLTGNRFKGGTNIVNNSLYVNTIDSTPLTLNHLPSFPVITTETHMPSRLVLYLATAAPYNAKGDGVTDNTTAIQNALNQAATDGGGIVFLPPGKYKVLGNLTVPANVELKGSSDVSTAPTGPGSTLEIYAGQGNANGTPFLRLTAGSGIRGLTLDYPNQTGNLVPNFPAYPYAIQGMGSNIYIVNIGIRAAYNGIDLFTHECDNHYVDFLAGQVFNNAIRVGNGSVGGKIYNLHFNTIYYANGSESKFGSWPNSPTNDGDGNDYTYDYNNVNFLEMGNCSGEILYNDFVYGSVYGLRLLSDGAGPSGISLGLGIDGTRHSVSFEGMGTGGFDFINSQIVSLGDSGNNYIVTSPGFTRQTNFYSADYWGNPYNGVSLNGGTVSLQLANFNQPGQQHWGNIQSGSLAVHNSYIWPVSAILNSGAEPHLSARSSIIDSSGIVPENAALWKDNIGNSWLVSTAGAMNRQGWTATSNDNNGAAQLALDSNESTRWTSGASQTPGMYFIVDMKTINTVDQIVLDATPSPGDSPVGYDVYISSDSVNWTGPVAAGAGAPGMTLILFSSEIGRYIKIVQTGSQGNWWSIHEFYVWGKVNVTGIGITPNVALLYPDSTSRLSAVISPANATNKTIAWSSSNTGVVTVDSTGLLKGVDTGTAIIQVISLDARIAAFDTVLVSGSTPFTGTPALIPGKIEAENYDNGGPGVAYVDSDPTNDGGQYRPADGVDIENSSEGGYDVGWTAAGEWEKYTVNVTSAGVYTIQARIASPSGGASFHIEMNGVNISGSIPVPNTGGWQTWQTVTVNTPALSAGLKVMRIVMETSGFNVDYVTFVKATGAAFQTVALSNTAATLSPNSGPAGITVYPNPLTGQQLNLQFVNQPAGKYAVRLFNDRNQPVLSKGITLGSGTMTYTLTLGRKPTPGVYLLELIGPSGASVITQQILIP